MSTLPVMTKKMKNSRSLDEEFQLMPVFSDHSDPLVEYRKEAWKTFEELKFPPESDEAWRRTSLRALQLGSLQQAEEGQGLEAEVPENLVKPLADDIHGGEVILSQGRSLIQLDKQLASQGVVFTDLRTAQVDHPQILEKVLKNSKTYASDKFSAMTAAFSRNGILLYVPVGVTVDKPLHSLIWTSGSGFLNAFQIFVYLDENATATYVHESSSPLDSGEQNLHTALMDVNVAAGAKLNFVELQSLGIREWNITRETVNVGADAEVDWIFGALGSRLTKNFSDLNLVGKGSTGKMSGFFFTNGQQHLDHDTQQNHMAANTTSDLLFKGALLGESRSVWQGMIYVAENASKTDGYQANRNLILSEKARADSIPGLEILTDDVRCTHGATVGKIDEEQVFYLQSRGIPREEAERTIVEGFFDPIMQRIPFEGVRQRFQNAIEEKMHEN